MRTKRLRLLGTIGRSHGIDPDDTRNTKIALRDLGYYREPSFGITPYPDQQLFEGIEEFQDDFDLQKDGLMNPDGETERKLNEVIDLKGRPAHDHPSSSVSAMVLPRLGPSSDGAGQSAVPTPSEDERQQSAALPAAIPVIVYEVAVFFGMTLSAAYAWWISLSSDEKRQIKEQIQNYSDDDTDPNPNASRCGKLFEIDNSTCRQISKRRGKQAATRCYSSAQERYSACLKGRTVDELPPLDTWNH